MGEHRQKSKAQSQTPSALVANVEARLVAFGRIFEKPVGTAFLADIFVLPPWRGLGYGRP